MADRVSPCRSTWQRFNARIARYIQASGQDADAAVLQIATDVLADTLESWPVDSGHSRAEWWGPSRIAPASYQIGNPALRQGAGVRIVYRRGAKDRTTRRDTSGWCRGRRAWDFSTQAHAPLRRALSKQLSSHGEGYSSGSRTVWGR